jgi:2-phospho-L-lactate guanylyltransferase (CobY/MobA/RfbA family)
VLALPGGLDFRFRYAADSARRHREEAGRLGLDVHVISRGPWTRDVDHPEDLKDLPDSV